MSLLPPPEFLRWWYHNRHRGYLLQLIYDQQIYAIAIRKEIKDHPVFGGYVYSVKSHALTMYFVSQHKADWRNEVARILWGMRRQLRENIQQEKDRGN